ncbi:hypothetical protein HDE_12999 [Halotydeus destructor]|nr:hypothetical protein HDE_12999 [Halotydeus destructor]
MVQIRATGEGLKTGEVDAQLTFSVYAIPGRDFRDTLCSVAIEGPSEVDIRLSSRARGSIVKCEWTPKRPGIYVISVFYAETPIDGSPFCCEVNQREKRPAVPDCDGQEGFTSFLPAFLFSNRS